MSALRLRLPAGLAAAAACCLVLAAPAQAETVTANCDTPPATAGHCNHWYTTASVSLSWQWDVGGSLISGCVNGAFTDEGRQDRSCRVEWPGGTSITKRIWIGIDRTPPQVLPPAPSRPPDFNGWYNHPVDFAFRGTDLASGVASCSRATYGGPDGAGVRVGGTCRDKVGHAGAGAFAINYDATPPPAPVAKAVPGNRRVKLTWSSTPGTLAQVVRIRGSRARLVYVGPSSRFTDRRLRNGRRYRWLVSLVDQAGNRAADLTSAVPTSSPLLTPADGARLRHPPLLVWKGARRVRYFNAQLVRRGRKILSRWPAAPQLQLHRSWRFGGRRHRLVRGLYCWYVWPGRGAPSERRYGKLLGKSCFRMVSRRTTAL